MKLDPNFPTARLYLAMAYYMQYIPGAESPENQQMADHALSEFQKVLEQEPKNDVATKSIASLYYNEKKWDEAEAVVQEGDRAQSEKQRSILHAGRDRLDQVVSSLWARARAKLGMKPEDPGPIKDKKVKEELKTQVPAGDQ